MWAPMWAATKSSLSTFAIMGAAFARVVFGLERPMVGLLNIGTEEVKGNDAVKAAAQILRAIELPMRFHGFVEGDDISTGTVDVVVTDGFTGNVALKTAEGTAKLIAYYLKSALVALFVRAHRRRLWRRGPFARCVEKMDPRAVNGGVFLGLNGIVVKSHGGTDALGFAAALDLAIDMAASDLPKTIASRSRAPACASGRAGRLHRRARRSPRERCARPCSWCGFLSARARAHQ